MFKYTAMLTVFFFDAALSEGGTPCYLAYEHDSAVDYWMSCVNLSISFSVGRYGES